MKGLKVLLVDDEQEFLETLSKRLEMRDVETKLALDGKQALEAVQDEEPDVMVLDLKMPGMDGMEVLRRIKSAFPGVPVVMLTGHGTKKDEEQARELGAYAYLQKPVELNRLSEILREAFESAAAERARRAPEAGSPPATS
jgi:DNA-binding NtrC family response regulator